MIPGVSRATPDYRKLSLRESYLLTRFDTLEPQLLLRGLFLIQVPRTRPLVSTIHTPQSSASRPANWLLLV